MNILSLVFKPFNLGSIISALYLSLFLPPLPALTHNHQVTSLAKPKPSSSKPSSTTEEEQADFSGTGRPGRQTAGESRTSCPPANRPLTALIPLSHSGKTIAPHPTFWFYVPYNSKQITAGEFVLQNEQRQDVYRTPIKLNHRLGYLKHTLPSTQPPLEVDQLYVWYFKLYCDSPNSSSPLFVQGWIERISPHWTIQQDLQDFSTQPQRVYAKYNLWYDAINYLTRLYLANPNNSKLQADWQRLLQTETVNLQLPQLLNLVNK